ncbi:MAG: phenylalanine--tRNA ligase subunit alpha [Chloroflexi bacterium]|nr:phenylalanine--tRNA ligase subunit alpha [Chloroflexota bacterium]
MQDQLRALESRAAEELRSADDDRRLEEWRLAYLGRSGSLTAILRSLGSLPMEERRQAGASSNEVKTRLETALAERTEQVRQEQLARSLVEGRIDVTLPGRTAGTGRLHPTTQVVRRICGVFQQLGFQIIEGPEVELDYYNFEALNIPKDHPARDMWDTFWIAGERPGEHPALLRTHTSPMQIRIMEQTPPPVRVVVPGLVYRFEATDATHESMFYQVEGLAVDKDITMADLKGVLAEFAQQLFGQGRRIRFRCDYFPFVEPGVEVSIDCFGCNGAGCSICRQSGWIEIMGAGMVHPDVLRRVGYDPDEYTGFAFGMGPDRVALARYGIEDIRLFYSNDIRFLKQF